ncbi:MAG TPA: PqqD family protein [Candidatus Baltobacteraceae bacterium]
MPVRSATLEIHESGDDVLVHDLNRKKIHVLNATAGKVLRACDGRTSAETVMRSLDPGHGEEVARDLVNVLAEFTRLGLISGT